MRIVSYFTLGVGAIAIAITTLIGIIHLGTYLTCRVVPICKSEPPSRNSVHEIHWTGNTPDHPVLSLKIPREYITFYIKPTKKETTEFVRLSTQLPELAPRISHAPQNCPSQSDSACQKQEARNNDLDIELRSDLPLGLAQPSSRIGTEEWAKIYPRFKREPDKMGFQHYVEHGGPKVCVRRDIAESDPSYRTEFSKIVASTTDKYVCWPAGDEIFVSVGDARQPDTVIRCGALFESVKSRKKCVADINFNSWGVNYRFPGSELNRWREFDTGTRELLQRLSGKLPAT